MCIAIWKDRGQPVPKKTVLKRCFRNNPDGAGFAEYDETEETWHVAKGFMSWKAFWKAFNSMAFDAKSAVIIHFRVSTSGKRKHPDCTHPFPVTDDVEMLMEHRYDTVDITMHNGVCGPGEKDLSDTQVAIRDYTDALFPYREDFKVMNILGEALQDNKCRWFLAHKDQIWKFGDWVIDEKTKVTYSNKGYVPPTPKPPTKVIPWQGGSHSRNVQTTTPNGGKTTGNLDGGAKCHKDTRLIMWDGLLAQKFCIGNTFDWSAWNTHCKDFARNYEAKETEIKATKHIHTHPDIIDEDFVDGNTKLDTPTKRQKAIDKLMGRIDRRKGKLNVAAPKDEGIIKQAMGLSEQEQTETRYYELYDLKEQPLAICDSNGDILWDDEWEGADDSQEALDEEKHISQLPSEVQQLIEVHGVNHKFDCMYCGNEVTLGGLTGRGECCFCYETLIPVGAGTQAAESTAIKCPNCSEQRYIVDSDYNAGDSKCCRCGAVFYDDRNEIVLWDLEIARDHAASQKLMEGGK